MYFPDATNQQIFIDLNFSFDLDFLNFNKSDFQAITINSAIITLDLFTVTYT